MLKNSLHIFPVMVQTSRLHCVDVAVWAELKKPWF